MSQCLHPALFYGAGYYLPHSADLFYTDEREPISSGVLLGCVPDKARASAACIHTHPNYPSDILTHTFIQLLSN